MAKDFKKFTKEKKFAKFGHKRLVCELTGSIYQVLDKNRKRIWNYKEMKVEDNFCEDIIGDNISLEEIDQAISYFN